MVLLHEHTSAKSRDDVTLLHGLDHFPPRCRKPTSIAQSKCSFHHQKFNHPRLDTREHDSTQTKFNPIYRKKVPYRPYPRPRVYRNRLIFLFPFSFESDVRRSPPAPRVAARAALVYRSTSFSSAPRDCTVLLRLALGAPCAHIHFFFSRTLRRCRSQYLKANGIKERYPQVVYIFFEPHTYSRLLPEENIHQKTRPRNVARPLPVYSPTRSWYIYLE